MSNTKFKIGDKVVRCRRRSDDYDPVDVAHERSVTLRTKGGTSPPSSLVEITGAAVL
jgi:hypothetical protein